MPPTPSVTVLGRAPEPGRVKTRLAASIGAEAAAAVQASLGADVLARLAAWRAARGARPEDLVLALGGDAGRRELLAAPARERFGARVEDQGEGELGRLIEGALARRAAEGSAFSLVVGTDAPLLDDALLDAAASAAVTGEEGGKVAVLAPSTDGGFVLIGAGRLAEGLLAGLPWGGAEAFAATWSRLRAGGLSVRRLPGAEDVDDLSDLRRLAAALDGRPELAPATAAWLERNRDAWAEAR